MKSKFTSLSIAEQDESNTVKFFTNHETGVTVCRLYDRWHNRYFTAKTKCLDVDKFSEKKGRAIAFNKARRKELLADLNECHREFVSIRDYANSILDKISARMELKRIYLAGVDDELRELMNNENFPVTPEPETPFNPNEMLNPTTLIDDTEKDAEHADTKEKPVLKQFSSLKED